MSYIGQPYGLGKPTTYTFTATGGETTLTTSDDGRTLTYTPGNVEVFLNGVRLVSGVDYTALSGSSVSGLDPLVSGDVVVVVVLASQSVADAVSAASGGEFLGDVTVPTLNASTVGLGDGTAISSLGFDVWRMTSNITSSGVVTALERQDDQSFDGVGSGVSVSSGVFTFPTTGVWFISAFTLADISAGDTISLMIKNNNGDTLALSGGGGLNTTGTLRPTVSTFTVFVVTDTATDKVRFEIGSVSAGTFTQGFTDQNRTAFAFLKVGDL